MPNLSVTLPHSLGREEALARLKRYIEKLKARHEDKFSQLDEQWQAHRGQFGFSAFGFSIRADLAVEDDQVQVSGTIPLAAMLFKGKIEQGVRDELTRVLA